MTDPAARRKILRQKARCFLCLKCGHLSRDCPSQSRCFRCNQRHHASICQSLQQLKPSLDNAQDVSRPTQSVQSSASARQSVPNSESSGEKITTGLYVARPHNVSSSCTLLQTARATVYSPLNDDVSCQARIRFDLGSQKSYVNRALKSQWGLIPIRTDKILLKTFGSNEPILKTCKVVQISIQCQDELLRIQAYVVDIVCSPISNQFIEVACSNYPHVQSLPLADCNSDNGDLNVQIFIGGDFYWSFMQNEVIQAVDPQLFSHY